MRGKIRLNVVKHRLSANWRTLPNFLIIGVPRSGTTSLYNYMTEHPLIKSALVKEVQYFSSNFEKGLTWYRSNFPLKSSEFFLTGEASPNYLYHPQAPKRIKEVLPDVKMILLLRNPIDRANSNYWQRVRVKREKRSFEEIVNKEISNKIKSDEEMFSGVKNPLDFEYLSSGIYVHRLKRYYAIFPKEQIKIIPSEEFYADPQKIINSVCDFLNIEKIQLKKFKKYNFHKKQPKIDNSLREKLSEFYDEYNEQLFKLINKSFSWN